MKKYLIIGNAENTHMLKWVRSLACYFEVYLISSKTTLPAIHETLPADHIFDLGTNVSEEGGNYKLLLKLWKVRKIIKKTDPDLVNAHYITSHGFLAALVKKLSTKNFILVQSAWGSDILVTPFRNKLFKWITRFCLRNADVVTSDSHHMTEVISSLAPVKTLTFSFGLEKLPLYDTVVKEDYLFYSNRMLSENYNIGETIRFFGQIAAVKQQARLVIAHDGPSRKYLEQLVGELGLNNKITFMGFVSEEEQDINYKKARFFISIPTSDATSVSLLEAMAYGCIPIVSDIPANHEWISNGVNGIFYHKHKTRVEEIINVLKEGALIAERNREIIKKRAIFPDAIRDYVEYLKTLSP